MPKGSNLALMDLCLQVFEFFKFGKTLHLHGWERDGEAMLIYVNPVANKHSHRPLLKQPARYAHY